MQQQDEVTDRRHSAVVIKKVENGARRTLSQNLPVSLWRDILNGRVRCRKGQFGIRVSPYTVTRELLGQNLRFVTYSLSSISVQGRLTTTYSISLHPYPSSIEVLCPHPPTLRHHIFRNCASLCFIGFRQNFKIMEFCEISVDRVVKIWFFLSLCALDPSPPFQAIL